MHSNIYYFSAIVQVRHKLLDQCRAIVARGDGVNNFHELLGHVTLDAHIAVRGYHLGKGLHIPCIVHHAAHHVLLVTMQCRSTGRKTFEIIINIW